MFSFVFGVFTLLGIITNTTVVVFKIITLFIIKATMLSSSFKTKALFHTVTLLFITLNTNMIIIRKQS